MPSVRPLLHISTERSFDRMIEVVAFKAAGVVDQLFNPLPNPIERIESGISATCRAS
jgi:hypothetical protein